MASLSFSLNCHNPKMGKKQKECRFTGDTQQTLLFSRNFLNVITHYQHITVLYTFSLLFWFLTFIFISVLSPCSKYPSKSWFILVDRTCNLLLFKYSQPFFRPSLHLLIFQGEISTLWKRTKEKFHLDHLHYGTIFCCS